MALMLGALHQALIGAGASDDEARKAAEEVAGYQTRRTKADADLMLLNLKLLKWMVGTNIVLNLIILGKVFTLLSVTLELLGEHMQTLIGEVREMRAELRAMRSEIDGGFHMMAGTDGRVEGLRMLVTAHGQRLTALERKP